jgi:dsRNA-specific ribonuclease
MESFYHERKQKGLSIPFILGLTASPVMRSDPQSLVKIEQTLDAICRTPTTHRAQLRLKVNLPVLSHVYYHSLPPEGLLTGYTRTIASLGQAFGSLNIEDDPYVLDLVSQGTERSLRKLRKVRLNHKTWCQQQMRTLHATSLKICHELGAWAADYYISRVVSKFTEMAASEVNSQGIWDVSSAEKQYLAKALKRVEVIDLASGNDAAAEVPLVSDKVTRLIETILHEAPGFAGIVFVQERALVAVLAHILSIHPAVRDRLRVGTMIGTSASPFRRNMGELNDIDMQNYTVSLFKSGVINLIVATSVLEEGIDVPACNLVICFHKPSNLKSFVQRRGRARHQESKLILLLESTTDELIQWEELEKDMKRLYEEEMRTLQEALQHEDTEEHDNRQFRVESTGALLDLDNAVPHLYHFCATLPAREYVDLTPEFICSEDDHRFVRARVILPLSVNEAVRTAECRKSWMSEKNAIKDSAFEAYVALYEAGLVNQHLLPLLRHDAHLDELTSAPVETRASIMIVNEQMSPWVEVAKAWKSLLNIQQFTIKFGDLEVLSYLPIELPEIAPFTVYWDTNREISVKVQSETVTTDRGIVSTASQETWSMLDSAFGARFPIQRKQTVMLFSSMGNNLVDKLGRQPVSSLESSYLGLIREGGSNVPYLFREWLAEKPSMEMVQKPYLDYADMPKRTPHLSVTRLPRRWDFLHKMPTANLSNGEKPYSVVLPTSRCSVDNFPFEFIQFALAIPSIMRRLEIYLLAHLLGSTILRDVGIGDISLIVTAISASSANEETNYQRLEFFGDMILKLCTSVQLASKYPLWHEGYLSAQKDRLVANSRLSRAAIETGLDRFIVTKAFTGRKWRPLYVDDLLELLTGEKRDLSTKVLADVVEALIGAAMVDGGFPKALACLRVFLPELEWQPLEAGQVSLLEQAPDLALPGTLQLCEELVGYQFNKKSLLIQAMTHASCGSGAGSLERLEFLGDGILDRIITTTLFEQEPPLSHFQMHVIRSALVNADFLGFTCMEWATTQGKTEVVETCHVGEGDEAGPSFQAVSSRTPLPLWRFLRHHSPKLGTEQVATSKRHAELRGQINAAIEMGSRYPWALLARLLAPKFYSDIAESLLGAVWVDSGSWGACRDLLERMGILPYLRRIVGEGVQAWHPKEELGALADTQPVRYVIEQQRTGRTEDNEREFVCSVYIGEQVVASVGGGVSAEEVQTRAAETAVGTLRRPVDDRREGEGEGEMEGLE